MYSIQSVEITDFRSFRGKHKFKFPTEPGLYAITGKNLDNPRLGPNGVGKSTLMEAIYWCNYGKTTRGLKAGDVINWDAKSCAVTTRQTIGNADLTITRTQSPNSLRLNGNPVDQEELEKHLRLGPEAYTYAVMLPQFGDSFFDLSPADKLTLFSQIMELDFWLDKSKEADSLATELFNERVAQEQKKARYEGQLETIAKDMSDLAVKRDLFESDQKATIKELHSKVDAAVAVMKQHKKRLDETTTALAGLTQRLERINPESTILKNKKQALEANAKELYAKKSVFESKLSTVTNNIKRLTGLDATCPTCLQQVKPSHLKLENEKLKFEKQDIIDKLKFCVAAVDRASDVIDEVDAAIQAHASDQRAIENNISDFTSEKRVLSSKLEDALKETRRLERATAEEGAKSNPYSVMINDKKNERTKLQSSIAKTTAAIEQATKDHAAVSFWVSGFKRVRLFIVEQTLRQLELEINNCLGSLGLLEWHIELDVERENKSGGITKGFTVLVHAPGHDQPVKWEAWSGGETQRLRLAGNLGLANLIMERAGLTSAVEFYDEPSRHLSQEGMLDLAETLYQRAIDTERSIFVIEHNLLDYPYTGAITVVKDGKGSHIETTQ